jgi:hypothetical protein
VDQFASGDYIYRLSPGEPERYEPIPGRGTEYQNVAPVYWPFFGNGGGDLVIGYTGPPGTHGRCTQGPTYRGSPNAACGGGMGTWGHTDLEVWRPL